MKKKIKREEIIKAAKKLIIEKGYRKTSVQDITDEVGIAKGSFYTYFKSKDSLMETLLLEKREKHKGFIKELFNSSRNLEETIRKYITYYFHIPTKDMEFILVMLNMMRSIDSVGKNIIKKLELDRENRKNEFVEILKRYEDEIEIKENKDFERYGSLVFGMINIFYINNFLPIQYKFTEIGISELKKKIEEVDFEYEIDFMTRSIFKLISK